MTNFESKESVSAAKAFNRAQEIKREVPAGHLPEAVDELKKYVELRQLAEVPSKELPADLRRKLDARDPNDVFEEKVVDFDPWDVLTEMYGHTPDRKEPLWTIDELQQLVKELEKNDQI